MEDHHHQSDTRHHRGGNYYSKEYPVMALPANATRSTIPVRHNSTGGSSRVSSSSASSSRPRRHASRKAGKNRSAAAAATRKWKHLSCATSLISLVLLILIAIGLFLYFNGGISLLFNRNRNQSNIPQVNNQGILLEQGININQDSELQSLLNNDDNLNLTFYGLSYSPRGAIYPNCANTLRNVTLDLSVIFQVTTRIRTFNTDCRQVEQILAAIEDLDIQQQVNLLISVWLDSNIQTNARQLTQLYAAIDAYKPREGLIMGIIISNEPFYRHDLSEAQIIDYINDIKENLIKRRLLNIKVGIADQKWTSKIITASDIIVSSVHPFFSGSSSINASIWAHQYQTSIIQQELFKSVNLESKSVLTEIGWPVSGKSIINEAVAGIKDANIVLNDWLCNKNSLVGYFWFEAFDDDHLPNQSLLKSASLISKGRDIDNLYGIFSSNDRRLKSGLSIPICN